jgi:hypothetical protein
MNARVIPLAGCWLMVWCWANWSGAEEAGVPYRASRLTQEKVREALQREVYGLGADRERMLLAAAKGEADAPLPQWYLGRVQSADGAWKSVDEAPSAREGQLYREYVAQRNAKADDAAGQKSLADWCERNGLKQQERAHLIRSLTLNPSQAELRQRLDQVRIGNQWVDRAAVAREQVRQKELRAAWEKWHSTLAKIAPQLTSPDEGKREAAENQIRAINDVGALPTLLAVLGSRGESEQLLILDVCKKLPDISSTELIAWMAAESVSPKVREAAAEMLKPREMSDYVPLLISTMFTSISSQMIQTRLPDGRTVIRKAYWREGIDQHQLIVADATFSVPASGAPVIRSLSPEIIRADEAHLQTIIELANSRTEIAVAERNRLTEERNDRIAAALSIATGEKLPAKPDAWWQWWLDLTEWTLPNGKGLVGYYEFNRYDNFSRSIWVDWTRRMSSCLNAGTPIWTDQGPVAVDRLKIGDLVLSRDVETGELAYKPVILTTVRAKRQLTELTIGKERIQATGGHLFWVSGTGWVRAKELQSSDVLHTATNPVKITDSQPGILAETYNLVVDDFHTYFVGDQKLLTHDNTPRRPTRMVVPGLPAE